MISDRDLHDRHPDRLRPASPVAAHPVARRRLLAHVLLDWADEPVVVVWTLLWINPTGSTLRALVATVWVGWVTWQLTSQARTGQTFGKRRLGIQVVDATSGAPLGLPRTLMRWLAHGIDSLTVAGWVITIFTNRSAADRLLGSIVRSG